MPGYAPGQPGFLDVNRQGYLWLNDTVAAGSYPGSLSYAYQLRRIDNAFYPWGAAFEVYFAGNPGVFEIDIVGANIDAPQNYTFLGSITAATSFAPGSYVGRWDMPSNMWVKYVAAWMKTLGNSVPVTLSVTR